MSRYVNIPAVSSGGGAPTGWQGQQFATAIDRVSTLNRYYSTDLLDGAFTLGGVEAPDPVTTISGGVYVVPGGNGSGFITMGPTATQVIIASPKAESWYASSRIILPQPNFTSPGNFVSPIAVANGASAWTAIAGNQATDTDSFKLYLNNNYTNLSASATIGSTLCPIGSWFEVALWFNVGTGVLGVDFSGETIDTFSGAQLTNMPNLASVIECWSNDVTFDMRIDSMFVAWVASV